MHRRSQSLPAGSRFFAFALLALAACTCAATALADPCDPAGVPEVLDTDPCDPLRGHFAMLPGVPLIVPADGARGTWSSGEPDIDAGIVGDVDLIVRYGTPADPNVVPAPQGDGGAALPSIVVGGGQVGQGPEAPFTVMLSNGPGVETWGTVLRGTEMDGRPVAVYAFADLDGDGYIGPKNSDGSFDNEIEKQEALATVGRQAGQFSDGSFSQTLGIEVAAPASMGGLRVALFSGAYTGADEAVLWSDGAPIFTSFPFFPPLTPEFIVVIEGHPTPIPPPPDPEGPLLLQYRPAEFFLPEPDDATIGTPFAIPVDGTNITTDQFLAVSGVPVGVEAFRDIAVGSFRASARMDIRPAPAANGVTPTLVRPVDKLNLAEGNTGTIRLLQVDALGNVADPVGSVQIELTASGGLAILAPDIDNDPSVETVSLASTKGVAVTLSAADVAADATLTLFELAAAPATAALASRYEETVQTGTVGRRLLRQIVVDGRALRDSDSDGVADDGDGSGVAGDRPCSAEDISNGVPCDDNCPRIVNPSQVDDRSIGRGNCCNGDCLVEPTSEGCSECPDLAARHRAGMERASLRLRPGGGLDRDKLALRVRFSLDESQSIRPDDELVSLTLSDGDRIHWYAPLAAKFTTKAAGKPFTYRDLDGVVAGVQRARIKIRNSLGVKASVAASGLGILDTEPGENVERFVLSLGIGDDAYSVRMNCVSSLRKVKCRQQ
jgi:hypothetical protein